jgi:hypothetical protein
MSQPNRIALVIDETAPVNAVVLPDGAKGDELLTDNPDWVEVTGLDPMPGVDSGWTYVDGVWVAPPVAPVTHADVEAKRAIAYRLTSDALFFQWQRGEATEQDWLAAVQAVKDANPYPEA